MRFKRTSNRDDDHPAGTNLSRDINKLVEAAAKLTLKLADEHQLLLQDCGFTWFVSSEQGDVLPMMFGISSEWKKLREENPQQIKRPQLASRRPWTTPRCASRRSRRVGARKRGSGSTRPLDPIKKELVAATREPLTAATMERIIIEMLTDIKEPGVLHKFHASHTPQADANKTSENKEVCFTIQVSLRNAGERLHRNLPQLCNNMVLKLLGSRLRQERKHRHGLAKHLEGLLYKQCWAYACKILVTREQLGHGANRLAHHFGAVQGSGIRHFMGYGMLG
eukprot:s6166_g2.t1